MSYLFRSAAMTLLSKTLQTFLSKYLSDVDVEGVELPSLYYTDEQSGYGVRLSNVKLRDGAQLMDLPGKRRQKKKKKKRRRKPSKKQQHQSDSSLANDGNNDGSVSVDVTAVLDNNKKQARDHTDDSSRNNQLDHDGDDDNNNGIKIITTLNDETVATEQELYYYDSDRSTSSDRQPSRPQTPIQRSGFFCFSSTPKCKSRTSEKKEDDDDSPTKKKQPTENDSSKKPGANVQKDNDEEQTERRNEPIILDNDNHHKNDNHDNNTIPNDNNDNDNDNNKNDDKEDESAFYFSEKPMLLQLGKDGRIGTLDIRFVKKELHVLIEDAFLTVEAIPKEEKDDEKKNTDKTTKKADSQSKKKEVSDKTPGDRIIANNPIAKGISSIPHLFLRDVRIRFVVRGGGDHDRDNEEEEGNNNDNNISSDKNKVGGENNENEDINSKKGASEQEPISATTTDNNADGNDSTVMPEEVEHHNEEIMDTVLEFGIDFLSVTSGEDFLSKFKTEEEGSLHNSSNSLHRHNSEDVVIEDVNSVNNINSLSNRDENNNYNGFVDDDDDNEAFTAAGQNEYLFRRIRTGKGPDGGLWLRVFPPLSSRKNKKNRKGRWKKSSSLSDKGQQQKQPDHDNNSILDHTTSSPPSDWARYKYTSISQNYFFRCSGLDINARIFLGTKVELSAANNFFLWSTTNTAAETMLYDSIAPGPLPPENYNNDNDNSSHNNNNYETTEVNNNYYSNTNNINSSSHNGHSHHQEDGEKEQYHHHDDNYHDMTTFNNNSNNDGHHHQQHNQLDVTTYQVDQNGILSNQIKSNFHRVARGLLPTTNHSSSTDHHLPCEDGSVCWEHDNTTAISNNNIPVDHLLDSSLPMPGLALSVSLTDSLEVNIDRKALEVIGLVMGLFSKPKEEETTAGGVGDGKDDTASSSSENEKTKVNAQLPETGTKSAESVTGATTTSSSGTEGSITDDDINANNNNGEKNNNDVLNRSSSNISNNQGETHSSSIVSSAFPTSMKPEAIQLMGIHISEVRFRIHIMEKQPSDDYYDDDEDHDTGLSFCYWEAIAKCITLDMQTFSSEEERVKTFQDLRLDVGLIQVNESRGTCRTELVSFGIPYHAEEDIILREDAAAADYYHHHGRPPWPTTVCSLLELFPPRESLVYESRERHGFQMRFISVLSRGLSNNNATAEEKADNSRKMINMRVGVTSLNLADSLKGRIDVLKDEIGTCLSGSKKKKEKEKEIESNNNNNNNNSDEKVDDQEIKKEETKSNQSMMKYAIQIDGGRIRYHPLVELSLPLTKFSGEQSTDSGIFFHTILNHIEVKYGKCSKPPPSSCGGLSLIKMAELPESVRLRILVFLEDLSPLEKALGVKTPESNSFFACRAVNKRIVKLAKKAAKSMNKPSLSSSSSVSSATSTLSRNVSNDSFATTTTTTSRRQKIMTEMLKLDDDALESLWMTHVKKNQKKRVKKKKGPPR